MIWTGSKLDRSAAAYTTQLVKPLAVRDACPRRRQRTAESILKPIRRSVRSALAALLGLQPSNSRHGRG